MQRIKCCIVGDEGVGKTSAILAFMDNLVDNVKSTIGVDFYTKTVYSDNSKVHLAIWDTAGAERYRSLMRSYLRDAHIILIAYDVTNRKTDILQWLRLAEQYKPTVVCLLGIKDDLTCVNCHFEDVLAPWKRQNWKIVQGTCSSRNPKSVKKIIQQCVDKTTNHGASAPEHHKYIRIAPKKHQKQKCCT
jgi:small GTP-binding protein|tara:strand:+ start:14395 stop:14961 length:567 start_codon:yes stop_codon:yes gene_type:complete